MRIPFDLIAAILCIEGLADFLAQTQLAQPEGSPVTLAGMAAVWAGFILICWLLGEWVIRDTEWRSRFGMYLSGFATKRHPSVTLGWATNASQVISVLLFAAALWYLQWPAVVKQWPTWFGLPEDAQWGNLYLSQSALIALPLSIGPFVAGMAAGWLPRRRLISLLRGEKIPLAAFLLDEARMAWVPLIMSGVQAVIRDLSGILPEHYTAWAAQPGIAILLMLFGAVFTSVFVIPKLVVWLFRCEHIPEGELKQRLEALLARSGVKTRHILTWGPASGHMINACVMGILPRYRYVLIGPALVERISLEETEAVLAHELGHARYGHLTLLFVVLLALSELVMMLLLTLPDEGPISLILKMGALAGFVFVYIRIFFGAVLRQCEYEADLASAEMMGSPLPLVSALEKLGDSAGHSPTEWTWHHGSIAQRVASVLRLSRDPLNSYYFHRRQRRFRIAFTLTTLAIIGAEIFSKLP